MFARTLHPRLCAGQRDTLGAGIFGLFHALQVTKLDRLSVGCIEILQGTGQALGEGIYRRDLGDRRRGFLVQIDGLFLAAVVVHQQVARDPEQPGARVLQAAEAGALGDGLEECVLQQILGGDRVAQLAGDEATQFGLVFLPGIHHTVVLH